MSKTTLCWALMLSLLPAYALAGCLPGQKITAGASIVWCKQQNIAVDASVSYVDPAGNPAEQSSAEPASVQAETSISPVVATPAVSFVAPDANAPVYFTISRSLYSGPSLAGRCIRMVGRIRTVNGEQYLDDGSAIVEFSETAGRPLRVPVIVRLHTDLLTSPLVDGNLVTVDGVCRQEADGSLSLLPMEDTAVTKIQ